MSEVIVDGIRYFPDGKVASRVSIHGMFDCHCFEKFSGNSVDEVIAAWIEHSKEDTIAYLEGDKKPSNIGTTMLCPAIVLGADDKELRRVGPMIPERGDPTDWKKALLADPDIPRLLAEGKST